MPTAYDGANTASTHVPPTRWRLALLAAVVLIVSSVALVAAVSLGIADPPCMRAAMVDVDGVQWGEGVSDGERVYYAAETALPPDPFTLVLQRHSRGADAGAAWGVWIGADGGRFAALVTRDGYLSVDDGATWREFPHIRRDVNVLCVHEDSTGATLYVNNEVAWRGAIEFSDVDWGYAQNTITR